MPIRISLQKDGPITLSTDAGDLPVLEMEGGEDIAPEGEVHLCRCGESSNKPFCDWTHVGTGYSDANRCENDVLQDYEAPGITVHFNRSICSGAAECVHNLPSVFESSSEDWIHPEKAGVDEVIATVKKCPSGALTYTTGGETHRNESDTVAVRVKKNGPYEIRGPVEMEAPRWSVNASRTTFALCRCGKSANVPFCDYSHGEQGWRDGS